MKTWQVEMLVVAAVLVGVVLSTHRYADPVEWIGAGAVLLSFGHAQVADRLAENMAFTARATGVGGQISVECFRWANRYLVGKEALWFVYFVMHGAYSALAGVVLFIAYPFWRAWWRS